MTEKDAGLSAEQVGKSTSTCITRKGERDEIVREIWNHDCGLYVYYVLAHVFERLSNQSYLLQSDEVVYGAHHGIGHGIRHASLYVGDVQEQNT